MFLGALPKAKAPRTRNDIPGFQGLLRAFDAIQLEDGGTTAYRGLVKVEEGATGAKSFVRCDALILDEMSVSETRPYMEVGEQDASIGHEATVSKIGDDQLFYLMSRGLTEAQAMGMIVNGFIEPVTRTLPMEYAVEWSRLIELQMEGAIG